MAEGQDTGIEQRLRQAYREERRWYNIRGASRLTLWLIALLAVAFLIDWGLFAKTQMSGITGLTLLLVNVGILIWVYHREWGQYLKSYDPLTTALEVEKRHPELSSLLVSYMQLKDEPDAHEGNVSQDLIKAMRDQAIEFSRPIDFKDIVDLGQLRKIGAVAVVLFLIFSIAGIFNREHTGVLFQRLLGKDAEYPTNTVITGTSENLTIRVGGEPVITATVAEDGDIPENGRLFLKDKNSSEAAWKEVPMKRSEDPTNKFSFKLKPVDRDTLFYVKIGDDRSEQYTINVITSPRIENVDIALQYPEYMNRDAGTYDDLNLEVPENTTVKWTVRCNTPVSSWEVLVPSDWGEQTAENKPDESDPETDKDAPKFRSILADLDEAGTTATFEIPVAKALKYSFRWTEKANGFQYEDVQYGVKVTTDGLPDVDLIEPREVGYATVGKVVKMEAKGTDDIGLDKAWLVYSLNGADETKVEIFNFEGDTNKTFNYSWKLTDDLKELKPDDRVSFQIEVADRHPDREIHLRRTAPRQLTIVTPEAYLEWYRTEYGSQIEELKRSRNQELAAQKAVTQIQTEEGIEPVKEEDDDNE
ncbi:MAG TPA: hypothetical protein DCQ96_02990 [Verrucomicrobiales bacterium]|nr:hypothetical protein [Verrucomicrobiales bacterium]|tara:strand:- start:1246 stop:3009 length:1764 start_codon:yes stop_codon:yes gene_type:complete